MSLTNWQQAGGGGAGGGGASQLLHNLSPTIEKEMTYFYLSLGGIQTYNLSISISEDWIEAISFDQFITTNKIL